MLLSDSSAYLYINTEQHVIMKSREQVSVRKFFRSTRDDLVKPTGIHDGCQHEFVCHSDVFAALGLGKCRTKLGVWTIGEVDVGK